MGYTRVYSRVQGCVCNTWVHRRVQGCVCYTRVHRSVRRVLCVIPAGFLRGLKGVWVIQGLLKDSEVTSFVIIHTSGQRDEDFDTGR